MAEGNFDFVRRVDFDAAAARVENERFGQELLGHASGGKNCQVTYIVTPAGGGSPAGLHTHLVDQIFYLLKGTMSIEVDGAESEVEAGSLIVFPSGVPHRNWNKGPEETVHLAINAPTPDPGLPFATSLSS
jgi:quercetin dioxygenase-like cupin family protein